jgi:hypothetical protein
VSDLIKVDEQEHGPVAIEGSLQAITLKRYIIERSGIRSLLAPLGYAAHKLRGVSWNEVTDTTIFVPNHR